MTVYRTSVVDFTVATAKVCLGIPVTFANDSSPGIGSIASYTWDFGNGASSTQQNPAHIFSKKGTYSIKFTVPSSEGCTVSFNSQSSPTPDNTNWSIDGVQQYYTYGSLSYVFNTIGNHTIMLNTLGTCPQSGTKTIFVKDLPYANGFTADIAEKCGSPVAVNFKDPTPGTVKWT